MWGQGTTGAHEEWWCKVAQGIKRGTGVQGAAVAKRGVKGREG